MIPCDSQISLWKEELLLMDLKHKIRLIILDISGMYSQIYDEMYIDDNPEEIHNAISRFYSSQYCIVQIKY